MFRLPTIRTAALPELQGSRPQIVLQTVSPQKKIHLTKSHIKILISRTKMDSPHLGHSQNLEQWDWGGEEQVYSKDAPHPDPLLLFNPFFSFSLAYCCCGEVLERERILWKDREMFRERSSKRRALGIRERVSTCVKR